MLGYVGMLSQICQSLSHSVCLPVQFDSLSVCQFNLVFSIANTDAARDRKQARYAYLKEDIEERGFHCFNNPLEIGTRGYISQRNKSTNSYLAEICKVRKPKLFVKTIGKIALLDSYQIYLARNSQDWSAGGVTNPIIKSHIKSMLQLLIL